MVEHLILQSSPVEFNEELHRYALGDKRLLGITGLIHEVLQLGVYPDANDFVRKVAVHRAGEYGSAVHKAIEIYDEVGAWITQHPNSYGPEPWEVSKELASYIRHREGFTPIANEYTVSDNEKRASNIDNVWMSNTTGGIWLVDTKTNNLDYYPLDGYGISNYFSSHEEALKEYLSWQLSIYAELFEAQNPGLKVEHLACNWLRKGDSAFWLIERKPKVMVDNLLLASYYFDEEDVAHYSHPDPAAFGVQVSVATTDTEQVIVAPDVVTYVGELLRTVKEAEAKLEEAKKAMRAAMEAHKVKTFKCEQFSATIAADSTASTFDSKKFKEDHPDLYKQYQTTKTRKGGFTLKPIDK